MGNDGGSIPDRRDLVKNKPKLPLREPVVSCALGKLYNKDAILEFLLDKSAYGDAPKICGHIKSIKDITTLKLTPNPQSKAHIILTELVSGRGVFMCPLNLKEMNGSIPFVYLATCGHVFSAAGLKAVAGTSGDEPCPKCGKTFGADDVRTLNPEGEELEKMRERMLAAKSATKTTKKRKAKGTDTTTTEGDPPAKRSKVPTPPADEARPAVPAPSINPSVSSVARKVTEQLAEEEKKRKATMSSAVKSLYGDGKDKNKKTKETFLTMGTFTRYA
ncbi:hypothetical protein FRB99_007916 [Tulasnella sp. 403]|nr:hypothetical protein FRB99_007916 [Tulasnella sp. 403]